MVCPGCGEKNRDTARFCTFCGTTLALRCPVCDTEIVEGGRFCDSCGTAVDPSIQAAPAAPAPAVAARKVVTVLFADLSGSTALEERMDAESVRSILDRFYAAMRSEVERHSGKVVKFTGDGVMAAFGVPEVHEDDAVRAIDAALAMRDELDQLANDLQLDVALNIGVNTGEVVVSETDDDVVGDAVNIAARLEGAATGGEILVGEETWRLTRATSRYEPVEPLTLKGKSEPVPAYRLLSVDERTADSATAPFVGREAELGRLLDVFQEAVDANAARLVTIIGSPGLGKTRLARELMSELSDVARVRETRCDPAGTATFAPIADALRAGSGITETDTEEDVIASLAARIPDDDPDRDRIAMRAAAIFGVGLPGTTEETFWALRRIIEAAARVQPVVFVLDDIHWAEPLLLDLIEHLAEWIRDAPVLLVGTARPELRDLRPSLAEGGRATAVIALEGLDRAATAKLALNLLGADELPAELLAKIPASTEGNPLFVRELVRMLVDDHVLLRTADGWIVTVDVEAIQVPPTIQSLLSARVDRLRSDERTVVELAAVVGKEFYRGALYDLAPASVKDLVDGCLESLRRKELVEPVGTYWIDEPVYRFHHVLIRDAAYRRLLKESRAELHERVAEWLEMKTADVLGEHEELVGYHLEQAHDYKEQLGRPDDALGLRAADLLGHAARSALDRDDLPAAATLSGRALDRLPAGSEERPGLLLVRCEALLSMGDVGHGAPAVEELERLANSPRLRAWVTCFNGQLANLTAPRLETAERVAAAATELTELGDEAGAAKAHTVRASTLAGLGRFADCESVLDEALTAARAAGDRRRITAVLGFAPHAALWGPNPVSRAGGRCLDIVRLLRITTGSPAVEATSTRCQAVLEAFRGRAEAARSMLRKARRTLTELGLEHELLGTEEFAGIVEMVAGDPAAAAQHFRTAFDGFRSVGVDQLAAQSAALLARAHLLLGEDREASDLVEICERLGGHDGKSAIDVRSVKAELLARRGDLVEARRLAEEAVELASRTDALFDHGNACRSLAAVCAAAGDAAAARSANERALALYERKGATALLDITPQVARAPAAQPTAQPVTGPPPNRCARVSTPDDPSTPSTLTRADIAARYTTDTVWTDNRRGFGLQLVGPAVIDNILAVLEVGAGRVDATLIATRGEKLALSRSKLSGSREESSFEVEVLGLTEINDDDLVVATSFYDLDDLDAAMTELDERFSAGEGASDPELVRLWCAFARAYTTRDLGGIRSLITDDLVSVDRRPASSGEMDADGAIGWIGSAFELTERATAFVSNVHELAPHRALIRFDLRGITSEGAEYESTLLLLTVRGDDRLSRVELYSIEQLDLARARFAELAPGLGSDVGRAISTGPHENAAFRHTLTSADAFERRDWDAFAALVAEDHVFDERQRFTGRELQVGRLALMDGVRAAAEIGTLRFSHSLLATRGERLALTRFLGEGRELGSQAFGSERLVVNEVNEHGLLQRTLGLDPDDLATAFAVLDEWFAEGEGAPSAVIVRTLSDYYAAYNRREWEACASMLTPDVRLVDHRPAGAETLQGRNEVIRYLQVMVDQAPDIQIHLTELVELAPTAALARMWASGTSRDGGPVEVIHYLVFASDGGLTRCEIFPLAQLDAAMARFEEFRAVVSGPVPENACVRINRRLWELYEREDWDGIRDLYNPDHTVDDRRPGLKATLVGDEANLENLKALRSVGGYAESITVVATRGDDLALLMWRITGPQDVSAFTSDVLVLSGHRDGRFLDAVVFDAGDLDAGFAELDRRWLASLSFPGPDKGIEVSDAYNKRDWARLRSACTDDLVVVDNRPASLGRIEGPDAWIDALRPLTELIPDSRFRITNVYLVKPDGALCSLEAGGTTADGAKVEVPSLGVIGFRDGLVASNEIFPIDRFDAALARYEELGARSDDHRLDNAVGAGRRRLENACTRHRDRWVPLFDARDWDGHADLILDHMVSEDHRSGLRARHEGREAFVETLKAVADIGPTLDADVIAIRGENLALFRMVWRDPDTSADAFKVEALQLHELDPADGRLLALDVFDLDDLDSAFAALDERYAKGEGAAVADVVRSVARIVSAYNVRDWDTYRSLLIDALGVVDHRPASMGTFQGADAWIENNKTLAEVIPDLRLRAVSYPAASPTTTVTRFVGSGTNSEGGEVEIEFLALARWDEGYVAHFEYFPPERFDEALGRFAELTRVDVTHISSPPKNLCQQTIDRMRMLIVQGSWDEYAACLTDDSVNEDRRPGLRNIVRGRNERVANIRAILEVARPSDFRFDVLATRGDRLVLRRSTFDGGPDGAYEVQSLDVSEIDADGRLSASIVFASDDLDGAFTELEARYSAGEGSVYAELWRLICDTTDHYNRRDWEAGRACYAVDHVTVDHRPASWGTLHSYDELFHHLNVLIELIPDAHLRTTEIVAIDTTHALVAGLVSGTSDEGAEIELSFLMVNCARGGKIHRLEVFTLADRDDALARFEELARAESVRNDSLENAAIRVGRLTEALVARQDWAAFREYLTEDCVVDDRRRGLRSTLIGRDARIENSMTMADMGAIENTHTPIATRGERLALWHSTYRGRGSVSFDVETLEIDELSEDGRICATIDFDFDDIDAAYAELDERFIAGEGAPFADVLRRSAAQRDALRRGDWETYRDLMADNVVLVDNRPASLGMMLGIDAVVNAVRELTPLVRSVKPAVVAIHRLETDRMLVHATASGTADHGGIVEMSHLRIQQFRDGRVVRIELFPVEQLDVALARFDEGYLENRASRVADAVAYADQSADWAGLRSLLREDTFMDDRRKGVGSRGVGADAYVKNFRTLYELGLVFVSGWVETLAVRGERLELRSGSGTDADGNEMSALIITEIDDDDLVRCSVWFDPEDLDLAFAELDERYLAGEGASIPDVIRISRAYCAAYNSRDWQAIRELYTEGWVLEDHRPASAGLIRHDELPGYLASLTDLIPDARTDLLEVVRSSPRAAVLRYLMRGTSRDGGPVELPYLTVGDYRDGWSLAGHLYPADRLDAALAKFAELDRATATPTHENEVTATDEDARVSPSVVLAMTVFADAYMQADWSAMEELFATDQVIDDRRAGLGTEVVGRDAIIDMYRLAAADLGFKRFRYDVVATRGDRLGLFRALVFDDSDNEVELLALNALDADGRFGTGAVYFDLVDLDAAFDELDDRWLASPESSELDECFFGLARSYNARDWDRMRSLLADDIIHMDHRTLGSGILTGADEYMRRLRSGVDLSDDRQLRVTDVRLIDGGGRVFASTIVGRSDDGGQMEWLDLRVLAVRDGKIVSAEQFPADGLDDAIARARELADG